MSQAWPKIIADPVHRIIPFKKNRTDGLLLALINTKEFQRLRRIKQLGVSELVFPGANHSRFAHSIGVMHTARMFLERVRSLNSRALTEDQELVVLAAALLHDIGHGPFSHAFEKVTGERHERRTLDVIRNDGTEVHQCLCAVDRELPERIALLYESRDHLGQIVNSQLDADRFDYLLRDSHATGTDYGNFDLRWLIEHLHVDESKGRFYVGKKALFTAEAYVFARYHMYRTVYFHKTTRAAEVMLRLLFSRYKELVNQTD